MLRRNLPLWKMAETVRETIAFCREANVGEIIWKIDAEEFKTASTDLHTVLSEICREIKKTPFARPAHWKP